MDQENPAIEQYGDFFLIKPLASGGKNELWLACRYIADEFQDFSALKILREKKSPSLDELSKIIKEGKTSCLLRHQNIVTCTEYGTQEHDGDRSAYMVMDYIFGKNLVQIQRRGVEKNDESHIPLPVTIRIMDLLCHALNHVHSACDPYSLQNYSLVHRDISPANIMLSYSGELKLIDFGIALQKESNHTKGKTAGKPTYMSPEQLAGQQVDARSDLYSMGVLFWELLCGQKLFDVQDSAKRTAEDHLSIDPPSRVNSVVPQDLSEICMQCLQVNPDDRYCSVSEFHEILGQWMRQKPDVVPLSLTEYMLQIFKETFTVESDFLQKVQLLRQQKLQNNGQERQVDSADTCVAIVSDNDQTEEYTVVQAKEVENRVDSHDDAFIQDESTLTV